MTKARDYPACEYRLLDFGHGRKLEQFGARIMDRPCPAAERISKSRGPQLWKKSHLTFLRDQSKQQDQSKQGQGTWSGPRELINEAWEVCVGMVKFSLKCSPVGQLGVFPEQMHNWNWLESHGQHLSGQKVLNLFGYSGGSTLAAARQGAHVTHVDAARNMVKRARQNAQLNDLDQASIRWIAEDALKYVGREIRRKSRYKLIILDPPSYGRGPANETWKMEQDLNPLLSNLLELMQPGGGLLLTSHTPGFEHARLRAMLEQVLPRSTWKFESGVMGLRQASQTSASAAPANRERELPSGHYVRVFSW